MNKKVNRMAIVMVIMMANCEPLSALEIVTKSSNGVGLLVIKPFHCIGTDLVSPRPM